MKLTDEQLEQRWRSRTERLRRLIEIDAPKPIIHTECLLVLRTHGLYKLLWQNVKSDIKLELWFWFKIQLWYKFILLKSDKEIDDLVERSACKRAAKSGNREAARK